MLQELQEKVLVWRRVEGGRAEDGVEERRSVRDI
jgi:hypothetical protein